MTFMDPLLPMLEYFYNPRAWFQKNGKESSSGDADTINICATAFGRSKSEIKPLIDELVIKGYLDGTSFDTMVTFSEAMRSRCTNAGVMVLRKVWEAKNGKTQGR